MIKSSKWGLNSNRFAHLRGFQAVTSFSETVKKLDETDKTLEQFIARDITMSLEVPRSYLPDVDYYRFNVLCYISYVQFPS